jgi:hypothetical protein
MTVVDVEELTASEISRSTKWGLQASALLADGGTNHSLPSQMTAWLLLDHMRSHPNPKGFIVSGHPSTQEDAVYLESVAVDFGLVVALVGGAGPAPLDDAAARRLFQEVHVERLETVDMGGTDTVRLGSQGSSRQSDDDDVVYARLVALTTAVSAHPPRRTLGSVLSQWPRPNSTAATTAPTTTTRTTTKTGGGQGHSDDMSNEIADAARELKKNTESVVDVLGQLESHPQQSAVVPNAGPAGSGLAPGAVQNSGGSNGVASAQVSAGGNVSGSGGGESGAKGSGGDSSSSSRSSSMGDIMKTPWTGPPSIWACIEYL